MGTCVSIHRDPKSNMRFRLAVGTKKAHPPPSHPKGGVECAAAGELDDGKTKQVDAASARWSPSFGSRDEIFFDSQAWLESDCEDFYSVNGDFTPSRGSTPNYQTGKGFGHKIYTNGFPESQPEPSPRKKLAELFQENPPGNLQGRKVVLLKEGHNPVGSQRRLTQFSSQNLSLMRRKEERRPRIAACPV